MTKKEKEIVVRDMCDQFHRWEEEDHKIFENERGIQIKKIEYAEDGGVTFTLVGSFQKYVFAKIVEKKLEKRTVTAQQKPQDIEVVDTDEFTKQDIQRRSSEVKDPLEDAAEGER